jgi:hypothetical protein
MAFRFSTKVRNDMMGYKARCNAFYYNATTMALVDGGDDPDSITDTDDGFVTAGFEPGDYITVVQATNAANEVTKEILTVVAGTITIVTGSFTAGQVGGAPVALASARGGSLTDQFRNGIMVIRSASQPTHADDTEVGSELVKITESSGDFVAGEAANGINFGQISEAELHAAAGEVWSGAASASATAGHFRIYDNDFETGADTDDTKRRIDGAIATSGSQMNMTNTSITSGGSTTIDDVDIPMDESA